MKIICQNCNAGYNIPSEKIPKKKAVATCKKCGGKIEIEPEMVDQTEAEAASQVAATPSVPPSNEIKAGGAMDKTITDAEFAAFTEQNSIKYISKFQNFHKGDTDGFSVTWHWPAFFTGIWWLLYRKLYLWALIIFVVSCIPLLNLASIIIMGMIGNYIYYKHAKKKILEIKSANPTSDISASLSLVGGVNKWVITVVTILIGIAIIGIVAAILMPHFAGNM